MLVTFWRVWDLKSAQLRESPTAEGEGIWFERRALDHGRDPPHPVAAVVVTARGGTGSDGMVMR